MMAEEGFLGAGCLDIFSFDLGLTDNYGIRSKKKESIQVNKQTTTATPPISPTPQPL